MIEHWIASAKYKILDEMFFKNHTTSFQIPTPQTLGIIRFWMEIYTMYLFNQCYAYLCINSLTCVSKVKGILVFAVFSVRLCGFKFVQFLMVYGFVVLWFCGFVVLIHF